MALHKSALTDSNGGRGRGDQTLYSHYKFLRRRETERETQRVMVTPVDFSQRGSSSVERAVCPTEASSTHTEGAAVVVGNRACGKCGPRGISVPARTVL